MIQKFIIMTKYKKQNITIIGFEYLSDTMLIVEFPCGNQGLLEVTDFLANGGKIVDLQPAIK